MKKISDTCTLARDRSHSKKYEAVAQARHTREEEKNVENLNFD